MSVYNEPLISATLSRITATDDFRAVKVVWPDGTHYQFNGTFEPLRGAPREIEPVRRGGSRNRVTEVPDIVKSPREVKLPAEVGLRFGAGGAIALATLGAIGDEILAKAITDHLDAQILDRVKVQLSQDSDIINITQTLAQTQTHGVGTRINVASQKKRKSGGKRVRIHGYSKR